MLGSSAISIQACSIASDTLRSNQMLRLLNHSDARDSGLKFSAHRVGRLRSKD